MIRPWKDNEQVEIIQENQWVSLAKRKTDDYEYVFSHETRCGGELVALLPYKNYVGNKREYLVRKERNPAWDTTITCAITGGIDTGDPADAFAFGAMELKEETGYSVDPEQLWVLGACYGVKSCDSVYHLLGVCLDDVERGEATGDDTSLEDDAYAFWASRNEVITSPDPILAKLMLKLEG